MRQIYNFSKPWKLGAPWREKESPKFAYPVNNNLCLITIHSSARSNYNYTALRIRFTEMGKRRKSRVSEEHTEEEDEEMKPDQEYLDGSSSSNEKSLYEVYRLLFFFFFARCFVVCGTYLVIFAAKYVVGFHKCFWIFPLFFHCSFLFCPILCLWKLEISCFEVIREFKSDDK